MIDSSMCFKRGDVSYLEPKDSEWGLGQIEETIYVKDVDEQIVHETTTIQSKDAGRIWFATTCKCLQQHNYRYSKTWSEDWWWR